MADSTRVSSVKLGLAVAWPAFWTGFPLKIAAVLLLLAMGVHPWEMPGLGFLLLISVPIDIWAISLVARTIFLERLRLEPPDGLGLTLWWQILVLDAVYLPLAWFVEGQTVAVAKSVAAALLEFAKGLPVAERIGVELVLWGSPATVVLLLLVGGWLFAVGWLVRRQAMAARPAEGPYPALIHRWDLMRVPADQALTLTVFTGAGVVFVLLFWGFLPVTTPHPHEDYQKPVAKAERPVKPAEILQRTENIIAQAEASVEALEAKGGDGKGKAKGQEKSKGQPQAKPVAAEKPTAAGTGAGAPGGGTPAADEHAHDHDSAPHSH